MRFNRISALVVAGLCLSVGLAETAEARRSGRKKLSPTSRAELQRLKAAAPAGTTALTCLPKNGTDLRHMCVASWSRSKKQLSCLPAPQQRAARRAGFRCLVGKIVGRRARPKGAMLEATPDGSRYAATPRSALRSPGSAHARRRGAAAPNACLTFATTIEVSVPIDESTLDLTGLCLADEPRCQIPNTDTGACLGVQDAEGGSWTCVDENLTVEVETSTLVRGTTRHRGNRRD